MNAVAQSENFTDAGQMWRYTFEDDAFISTVDRIWYEIKPLYNLLHDYVRIKMKRYYSDELKSKENLIPAHLLGKHLWVPCKKKQSNGTQTKHHQCLAISFTSSLVQVDHVYHVPIILRTNNFCSARLKENSQKCICFKIFARFFKTYPIF